MALLPASLAIRSGGDLKPGALASDVLRTARAYAIQNAEIVGTYHR